MVFRKPPDDAADREKKAIWQRMVSAAQRACAGKRLWSRPWVYERLEQRDLPHNPIPIWMGVDFLFAKEPDIRAAAASALESAIDAAPMERLDQEERQSGSWWGYEPPWEGLGPDDVAKLRREFGPRASLLGLLTLHHSGYVREAAVRELANVEEGHDLRFLLRRLNDWVGPVRDAAREVVRLRLHDGAVPHWLRLLPETIDLLRCGRVDQAEVVDSVLGLLLAPRHAAALEEAILALPRPSRARFFRRALAIEGADVARLIRYGLELEDPVVQLRSARKGIELAAPPERYELLLRLSRFRSMPVRRIALLARAEADAGRAVSVWNEALLDSHRSIRELAQVSLRAAGVLDVAEEYRRALRLDPDSVPALLGLGESGGIEDIPRFEAALRSPLASRRAAAVEGLARCAPDESVDVLLESLLNESPRVVREAKKQLSVHLDLLRQGGRDPLRTLLASLDRARSTASITAIIDLISLLGKWSSLPALLRLWSSPVEEFAIAARRAAERWFTPPRCHRVFTSPSPAEAEAIRAVVATLPAQDQTLVRSWVSFAL